VQKAGLTGDVNGGINQLGNIYNINGPTLLVGSLFYDKDKSPDEILKVIDAEVEKLRTAPVDKATLDRALVKMRSDLYDTMDGFGRADLLASLAIFYDDPAMINQLEGKLRAVTPELLQKTAREYLAPTNRTVLLVEAKGDSKPAAPPAAKSGS